MLQYTLPTLQNNPFFGKHHRLDSVLLLLLRSQILAFKQLMGQEIPFLQHNINIHLCFDNIYILSSYFSIWVYLLCFSLCKEQPFLSWIQSLFT